VKDDVRSLMDDVRSLMRERPTEARGDDCAGMALGRKDARLKLGLDKRADEA
jgi:hypothetical protein